MISCLTESFLTAYSQLMIDNAAVMRRKPKKASVTNDIRRELDRLGVNPLFELVKVLKDVELITEEDLDRPEVRAMLSTHEVVRLPGGKIGLRPNLKHRIDVMKELVNYQHPKLRTTEVKGTVDQSVTIKLIKNDPDKTKVIDMTPDIRQLKK